MKIIDSKYLNGISGSGSGNDTSSLSGGNKANSSGSKNSNTSSSGNYYGTHTNSTCVDAVGIGMLGGLAGVATGAVLGGCFDANGGNVGMGAGGNKSTGAVGSCTGKNGSGGCTW
jgi:hypothetical protein